MDDDRSRELFRRAAESLEAEEVMEAGGGVETPEPEAFLEDGDIVIEGRSYPEPTCYAYIMLERIATRRLPYELGPTERGLYMLWVVFNQERPAELAALTQRPLPESRLTSFAEAHPPAELHAFLREYPSRVAEVVRKKARAAAPAAASGSSQPYG